MRARSSLTKLEELADFGPRMVLKLAGDPDAMTRLRNALNGAIKRRREERAERLEHESRHARA